MKVGKWMSGHLRWHSLLEALNPLPKWTLEGKAESSLLEKSSAHTVEQSQRLEVGSRAPVIPEPARPVRRFKGFRGLRLRDEQILLSRKQRKMLQERQELWHRLALALLESPQLGACWAIGITSTVRGEGKSTTSIGLATALVRETNQEVLLVECNFSNPCLAKEFTVAQTPGLWQYLAERCRLDATIKPTPMKRLFLLPAGAGNNGKGTNGGRSSTYMIRTKLPGMLADLKRQFPYIVLDLPPLLGDITTSELARDLQGILLVVRSGVTPRERVKEATTLIKETKLVGTIHFGASSAIPRWLLNLISE